MLISKINIVDIYGAYEDDHLEEAKLDYIYSDYIRIEGFEEIPFMMMEDIIRSISQKEYFGRLNDGVDLRKPKYLNQNNGPFYSQPLNSIGILLISIDQLMSVFACSVSH
ncbi:hypothetical protein ANCCAN_21340 [Ancylostoma caninum]|uniref:Uncharacterized protein n=1 Tax=Ancylostoma caninum TaxID=29170 RepID=A0A368FPW8_ANCCA|nr:hypothetical protein ANCCAN_21340 [Ancylostoma caninum]